jgi:hypothetical protein
MGYKALGFLVWHGGKWYARRKLSGTNSKLAVAGLAAAVVGSAIAAGRQGASDS